jgi:hypothetical protein
MPLGCVSGHGGVALHQKNNPFPTSLTLSETNTVNDHLFTTHHHRTPIAFERRIRITEIASPKSFRRTALNRTNHRTLRSPNTLHRIGLETADYPQGYHPDG